MRLAKNIPPGERMGAICPLYAQVRQGKYQGMSMGPPPSPLNKVLRLSGVFTRVTDPGPQLGLMFGVILVQVPAVGILIGHGI